MKEKFIKISIDKKGKVSFTVEGVKGAACLAETKFLEEALGNKVLSRESTDEYYQEEESETVANVHKD